MLIKLEDNNGNQTSLMSLFDNVLSETDQLMLDRVNALVDNEFNEIHKRTFNENRDRSKDHQSIFILTGMAVGIIKNNKTFFINCPKSEPRSQNDEEMFITENSVFEIGSISKVFTKIILAYLVDKGIVNFDDTLDKFFSGIAPFIQLDGKKIYPTLRQLAEHKAGFSLYPNNDNEESRKSYENDINMLRNFTYDCVLEDLKKLKYTHEPGTKIKYTNYGYAVLGHVLAKEYYGELFPNERKFEDLLHEIILDPLEMKSTSALPKPYPQKWDFPSEFFAPAFGIRSTTKDMLRFIGMLMGYDIDERVKMLYEASTKHYKNYSHTGATYIDSSYMDIHLNTKTAVIILMHGKTELKDRERLSKTIKDALVDKNSSDALIKNIQEQHFEIEQENGLANNIFYKIVNNLIKETGTEDFQQWVYSISPRCVKILKRIAIEIFEASLLTNQFLSKLNEINTNFVDTSKAKQSEIDSVKKKNISYINDMRLALVPNAICEVILEILAMRDRYKEQLKIVNKEQYNTIMDRFYLRVKCQPINDTFLKNAAELMKMDQSENNLQLRTWMGELDTHIDSEKNAVRKIYLELYLGFSQTERERHYAYNRVINSRRFFDSDLKSEDPKSIPVEIISDWACAVNNSNAFNVLSEETKLLLSKASEVFSPIEDWLKNIHKMDKGYLSNLNIANLRISMYRNYLLRSFIVAENKRLNLAEDIVMDLITYDELKTMRISEENDKLNEAMSFLLSL